MSRPDAIDAHKFVEIWKQTGGSQVEVAKILGRSTSSVSNTRLRVEKKLGIKLHSSSVHSGRNAQLRRQNARRMSLDIKDGTVIAFGDCHYWPGKPTTAHRGLIEITKRLKPSLKAMVCVGDAFDGAQISRFDRIGWDQRPTVQQELEACQERLGEVWKAAGTVPLVWCLGNHDLRLDSRLAATVPAYDGVSGFKLSDHFPEWQFCVLLKINGDTWFLHSWHNGLHGPFQDAQKSAVNMVTGHKHSQKVSPWTNARETVYGVDCGVMADPDGDQFDDYMNCTPRNWRSGFAVLTFRDGKLLLPELAQVWDENHIQFRGELIPV